MSAFVAENVAKHFRTILGADKTTPVDVALRKAYMRTTKALLNHQTLDILITGTTAVVAIVHGRQLTCANVGDSRIVLGTVRKGIVAPLALTTDHLPEDPLEKERIEKAGGRVESWAPAGLDTGPPRVWLKEKRIPGLSISRVIGDEILSGIVSSEPDVSTHQLAEEDRFLIVATDGIWGVMSNEEVINFVAARDGESCQRVAEGLVRHAAVLWFDDGGESIDDISAIVVRFNW